MRWSLDYGAPSTSRGWAPARPRRSKENKMCAASPSEALASAAIQLQKLNQSQEYYGPPVSSRTFVYKCQLLALQGGG